MLELFVVCENSEFKTSQSQDCFVYEIVLIPVPLFLPLRRLPHLFSLAPFVISPMASPHRHSTSPPSPLSLLILDKSPLENGERERKSAGQKHETSEEARFFAKIKTLVFPQKLLIFLTRAIFCRQEFPGKTLLDHQLSLFIPYSKHLRRIWLTSTEERRKRRGKIYSPPFSPPRFSSLSLPPSLPRSAQSADLFGSICCCIRSLPPSSLLPPLPFLLFPLSSARLIFKGSN